MKRYIQADSRTASRRADNKRRMLRVAIEHLDECIRYLETAERNCDDEDNSTEILATVYDVEQLKATIRTL